MAKHSRFHHKHRASTVKNAKKPSPWSSAFILALIAKTILSIGLKPLRSPLKATLVIASLWLAIGALTFAIDRYAYEKSYRAALEQLQQVEIENQSWKSLLSSHPTAREALLGAYTTSVTLGKNEDAKHYLELLNRVDPNDQRIRKIQTTLLQ